MAQLQQTALEQLKHLVSPPMVQHSKSLEEPHIVGEEDRYMPISDNEDEEEQQTVITPKGEMQ